MKRRVREIETRKQPRATRYLAVIDALLESKGRFGMIALRGAIIFITLAVVGNRSAELGQLHVVPPSRISDRHRLTGVWRFQKEVDSKPNCKIIVIPGPSYAGLLSYTSDRFVSATVMPKGRAWNAETATAKQLRESVAEGSSTAYAGRYEVDPMTHSVTHAIIASVDPADEGHRLARNYAFVGEKLLLSGNWTYRGEALRFTVFWVRAK